MITDIIQNSQLFEQSSHQYVIIMITTANCNLSLQLTCQLVNLSTRQLQIMITTVNCGLLLQAIY